MDSDDLHPQDDYSHRFFIWHEWIQAHGPLTAENVFDYFATSMFYDKQSNNQVLRMQTMHTGQPVLNEAEELKRFTGIEFAVVLAQPPGLFVIHKRERLSPDEVRPLAAYFIMNNRVYQSPDVYTVLSNRLLTTLHSLQSSLDTLRAHRPDFTPRTGFVWPIIAPLSTDKPGKKRISDEVGLNDIDSGAAATPPAGRNVSVPHSASRKQRNLLPLFNAMRTTAAHLSTTLTPRAVDNVMQELLPSPPDVTPTAATPGLPVSATPAPARDTTRAPALPEPTIKPPAGGGKKKKKRMSNAPPAT